MPELPPSLDRLARATGRRARYISRAHRAVAMQEAWLSEPSRDERINDQLLTLLREHGPRPVPGRAVEVLEIGGRQHPRGEIFDAGHTYRNLDLKHTDAHTVRGDITHCPEIADASYDVVISVDVFEHINRPWLAAQEIERILRPGGLAYTSTLFSWRYHPCPIDYWRYSPDALQFLFDGLRTVAADFDLSERRRDVRKKSRHDPIPHDVYGGWRENVRVFHAGVKPAA